MNPYDFRQLVRDNGGNNTILKGLLSQEGAYNDPDGEGGYDPTDALYLNYNQTLQRNYENSAKGGREFLANGQYPQTLSDKYSTFAPDTLTDTVGYDDPYAQWLRSQSDIKSYDQYLKVKEEMDSGSATFISPYGKIVRLGDVVIDPTTGGRITYTGVSPDVKQSFFDPESMMGYQGGSKGFDLNGWTAEDGFSGDIVNVLSNAGVLGKPIDKGSGWMQGLEGLTAMLPVAGPYGSAISGAISAGKMAYAAKEGDWGAAAMSLPGVVSSAANTYGLMNGGATGGGDSLYAQDFGKSGMTLADFGGITPPVDMGNAAKIGASFIPKAINAIKMANGSNTPYTSSPVSSQQMTIPSRYIPDDTGSTYWKFMNKYAPDQVPNAERDIENNNNLGFEWYA